MEIAVTGPRDDDELTGLVGQARAGNTSAFDELAQRVRDRVRQWARRLVADDDDAEDVAQLVLVRLHERLDDFEGRSRFATWLYRITRNVALDRRRLEERRAALLAQDASLANTTVLPDVDDDATDAARIRRLIVEQFAELSPRQRDVFEMVDVRNCSIAAVARQLGIELGGQVLVVHRWRPQPKRPVM